MTQRPSSDDTPVEKILSRIGHDARHQMAWFVKLANASRFDAMTEGERLVWEEEIAAMLHKTPPAMPAPPDTKRYPWSLESNPAIVDDMPLFDYRKGGILPTTAHMLEVRDAITPPIERLADGKGADMGPYDFTYMVKFLYNPAHEKNADLPRYVIQRGEVATGRASNPLIRSLSFQVTRLLDTYGYAEKIHRCRLCRKVFLQLRRSATYCGPKCYTVGVMRELRERRRRERDSGITNSVCSSM